MDFPIYPKSCSTSSNSSQDFPDHEICAQTTSLLRRTYQGLEPAAKLWGKWSEAGDGDLGVPRCPKCGSFLGLIFRYTITIWLWLTVRQWKITMFNRQNIYFYGPWLPWLCEITRGYPLVIQQFANWKPWPICRWSMMICRTIKWWFSSSLCSITNSEYQRIMGISPAIGGMVVYKKSGWDYSWFTCHGSTLYPFTTASVNSHGYGYLIYPWVSLEKSIYEPEFRPCLHDSTWFNQRKKTWGFFQPTQKMVCFTWLKIKRMI